MAAIIKASKFILSKKSSGALVKPDKNKIIPKRVNIGNKTSALVKSDKKTSAIVKSQSSENKVNPQISLLKSGASKNILHEIRDKVIQIDDLLKSNLKLKKKQSEKERIKSEQKEFQEREEKLEKPKGMKIPSIPKVGKGIFGGFLEKVQNWIFFTALGWAFNKFFKHLPKLIGIVKLIGKVYQFGEGLFKNFLNGLVTFVSKGMEMYDSTIKWVKDIGGEKFAQNFDNFEKTLTKFIDLSIIASLLGIDVGLSALDELKKQKKTQKPGVKPSTKGGKPKVTQGRGGKKPTGKAPVTKGKGGKAPGWWNRIFKGPFAKLKGPLSKFAGAAVPGLGAAVGAADAKARFASGDNIGGALASVSSGLDAITAILALTGVGVPAAAVFGAVSIGIDVILLIRDIAKAFFPFIPMFSRGGRIVNRYQGGGVTTRGGKVVGGKVTRGATSTSQKVGRKLKKSQKSITSPGKDTGGDAVIKALFPDTSVKERKKSVQKTGIFSWFRLFMPPNEDKEKKKEIDKIQAPNAFKVIADAAKDYKNIGGFIGQLAGVVIDSLLGQKPSRQSYQAISQGIIGLVNRIVSNQLGKGSISVQNTISAFASGGVISDIEKQTANLSDSLENDLTKAIENLTNQGVNKTIGNIQKEGRRGTKKPIAGRDELLQRNLERAGGGYSEGGIATGLGVNKGVSVAKKLIADLGITPAQAAGIVGNFLYESAGMNPAEVEGSPYGVPEKPPSLGTVGVGYGWAQWTNSRPGDRLDKFLKSYGGDKGKIATDDDNYRYLMQELKGSESIRGMPKNDPQAASDWFRVNWERAGIPADEKRRRETLAVFDKIKGLTREGAKKEVEKAGATYAESSTSTSSGKFKIVQYITGDVNYKGDGRQFYYDLGGHGLRSNYHDHIAFSTIEEKEKAKRILKSAGIKIGSEFRPGDPGYHGRNLAIDIPGYQWGGSGAIGGREFSGSKKVRSVLGLSAYAKGGETKDGPHIAMVGEKGTEYVIDADSYKATEKVAPGLLDILNYKVNDIPSLVKNIPAIISSLSKGLSLYGSSIEKYSNKESVTESEKLASIKEKKMPDIGMPAYAVGGPTTSGNKGTSKEKTATKTQSKPLTGNYAIAANKLKSSFPSAKPYHIAAAIGNFDTEAPGLKPNTAQGGGGPGRGIAQWETPGRWDGAIKKYGPKIFNSLSQQLDFVKWEMDTGHIDDQGRPNLPWGRATKSEWLKSKNVTEATKNFMEGYEAPSIPHWDRRLGMANKILSGINVKPQETPGTSEFAKVSPNQEKPWWDVTKYLPKKEGGGQVQAKMTKPKSNLPIPNSYASYEEPSGKNTVFVQRIYVQVPSQNESVHKSLGIPVASSVNSNTSYSPLSRL